MSKPFQLTLADGVKEAPRKPGWHKRALAADKRAQVPAMRPSGRQGPNADAKAVEYARWLAARDGFALSPDWAPRVLWEACSAGMRPRRVVFGQPGSPVVIDLPHWSYVAPEVVESEMLDWQAPGVVEHDSAASAAVLAALADADAAAWCEAVAPLYGLPAAYAVAGTDPDGEADPVPAGATDAPEALIEGPEALTEVPTRSAPHPVQAIPSAPPVEEIGEGDDWAPSEASHPVIALCLSPKAQAALFGRLQDGTFPAAGRAAKGGAWRLSVADARDCEGIPSVRFIGLPRKPYTRRPVAPVEAMRAPVEAIHVRLHPAALGYPVAGMADRAIVYHSPA